MKIILTIKEILDKGLWDKVCDVQGYNSYAINEGLMSSDDEVVLKENQAIKLGLLSKQEK